MFAIQVYFDIEKKKKSAQPKLPNCMNQNYEKKKTKTYDFKAKQRFQQPHFERVFPGIVSEVTQDTERYHLSGLLVVMPCLLCMHRSGKFVGVKQKVAEKYNRIIPHFQGQPALDRPPQNQLSPIQESWYQISVQYDID